MNGTHPNNLQMNKVELIRFGHHFKAIKKNWLSIAAFTLLFSLTCTWYIYSKASIYQATATLLIQEEQKVPFQSRKYMVSTQQKKSTFKRKSLF